MFMTILLYIGLFFFYVLTCIIAHKVMVAIGGGFEEAGESPAVLFWPAILLFWVCLAWPVIFMYRSVERASKLPSEIKRRTKRSKPQEVK